MFFVDEIFFELQMETIFQCSWSSQLCHATWAVGKFRSEWDWDPDLCDASLWIVGREDEVFQRRAGEAIEIYCWAQQWTGTMG